MKFSFDPYACISVIVIMERITKITDSISWELKYVEL